MYMKNLVYVILMAFVMSSCAVGKKYVRPNMDIPITEYNDSEELLLADLKWWELYTDSNLQIIIRKTIENNKDLQIAASRIQELAYMRRIDNAALLPAIGAEAYGERESEHYYNHDDNISDEFGAKLTFSWEIDLFGNLRWARQKSIAEYLQSVEAQRALQMSLVAEVAQAYFELIALDNELDIVKRTLSTREEGVKQAKLRFEGGLTSETSYQQAQVELANTATLIPDLERQISAKQNEIAFICGEFPKIVRRSTDMESVLILPTRFTANLSSELLMRRPDVMAAEQSLIAANAAVGMAYADRFPRLRLTGAYGFENDQLVSFLKSPYSIINGTLVSPLFAFNAKKAKYKAQQAAYEQETARYEKTVLNVFRETSDAITAYNSARIAREKQKDLEQASKKYIELARLQYINGVISYLDVLDAQRSYFSAQIGLSNAIRDEYIAIVNLYKALGGGWKISDSEK